MSFNVTEVHLSLYDVENSPIVAFADVTIENVFTIYGIAVIESYEHDKRKMVVRLPFKTRRDGRKKDIIFVNDKQTFHNIIKAVLDYYDDVMKDINSKEPDFEDVIAESAELSEQVA